MKLNMFSFTLIKVNYSVSRMIVGSRSDLGNNMAQVPDMIFRNAIMITITHEVKFKYRQTIMNRYHTVP